MRQSAVTYQRHDDVIKHAMQTTVLVWLANMRAVNLGRPIPYPTRSHVVHARAQMSRPEMRCRPLTFPPGTHVHDPRPPGYTSG
jgi:hypothetical protein